MDIGLIEALKKHRGYKAVFDELMLDQTFAINCYTLVLCIIIPFHLISSQGGRDYSSWFDSISSLPGLFLVKKAKSFLAELFGKVIRLKVPFRYSTTWIIENY